MFFFIQKKLIYLIFFSNFILTIMKTNSKIIALDLQNAAVENLNHWFLTTDFITADATRNYIRHFITTWKDDEDPHQILFIINDFIFGFVRKNNFLTIEFYEPLIDEMMQLTPISLDEIKMYRSVIIDWIFNSNSTSITKALALRAFQKYDEKLDEELVFSSFISCVTRIEVSELGFNLKEFFLPLNDKFKAIVQEFRNYYGKGNYLKTVKLTQIFIVDKFILGYIFQLEGEPYEHFFWNIQLQEQLFLMDKTSFENKTPLSFDSILDKINSNGMESVTDEELNYLTSQPKKNK